MFGGPACGELLGDDTNFGQWLVDEQKGNPLWNNQQVNAGEPGFVNGDYPLVICYVLLWKDPPCYFHGKISTISIAIFNSYVKLPEGIFYFLNGT